MAIVLKKIVLRQIKEGLEKRNSLSQEVDLEIYYYYPI